MPRRSADRPTLTDVAIHAGVSPQTVSRAIRNPSQLAPETLLRVRSAIAATGYVRNLAASQLASARTMSVAVILPSLSSSIFTDTVMGMDAVLSASGYQLFVGISGYDLAKEEEVVRSALERQPDGVVLVGTQHTAATRSMLTLSSIPVVETWDLPAEPLGHVVGFSNEQAVADLTRQVIRQGYRRPVFAGPFSTGNERIRQRRAGFVQAVTELLGADAVRTIESGPQITELANGRLLIDSLLAEYPDSDLLVCASDIISVGALFECRRRGMKVPEQLAIAGFGDFDLARNVSPRLTTVSVPNREIGVRAAELLLRAIETPGYAPRTVDLGYSVVLGQST